MSYKSYLDLLKKYGGDIVKASPEEMKDAAKKNQVPSPAAGYLRALSKYRKNKKTNGIKTEYVWGVDPATPGGDRTTTITFIKRKNQILEVIKIEQIPARV